MGAFLDKPKTDKHNESGQGNALRYGLSSMQGWRIEMEDAHCAYIGLPCDGLKEWSFFAVFDGHAGAKVSAYCAEQLLEHICANDNFRSSIKTPDVDGTLESVSKGIVAGFLDLDDKMRSIPEVVSGEDKSGSTAIGALLSPDHIFFANCGDSRAILCRDSQVILHTQDHKPFIPSEKERIQNAGGSVMIQRVNGSLAVSRALGDFEYKNVQGKGPCEQLVSPEPEILTEKRSDKDEFIVLACDGIWDVMSNEDIAAFVGNRMTITTDLKEICNMVVDTCLHKGSRDNMSIVIIAFDNAPKISEEAQRKETELDSLLETKVKEILESDEAPTKQLVSYTMHVLSQADDIQGLPPGGGLISKWSKVEEIIHKLRPSSAEDD